MASAAQPNIKQHNVRKNTIALRAISLASLPNTGFWTQSAFNWFHTYIASHRHRNHVGGAPVIIQAMKPAAIYTRDARMRDRLLALASGSEEKAAVRDAYYRVLAPGDAFWLGPARLECLGPEKLNKYSVGAVGENYNSLILRLEYAARTMLLTGDTSASKLRDIPDEKLRCEVLKNPHHNGALGEKLLKRIAPQIVVVCNGKPPAGYYQKRIKAAGAKLYTAGKKGDGRVSLRGDEGGWVVMTGK